MTDAPEAFIPIRKEELVKLLLADRGLHPDAADKFRQLNRILSALFHYHYERHLQQLDDMYAPFDPDRDTVELHAKTEQEKGALLEKLAPKLVWLLERGNFEKLNEEEIRAAAEEMSAWGLNMDVKFDIFEKLEVFVRGRGISQRQRRSWTRLWRKQCIDLPTFRRLVLIVKLTKNARLPEEVDTDDVFLKMFKDIPRVDIEMLLPGARIKMPGFKRLQLGGSLFSGLAVVVYNVVKQLLNVAALGVFYLWGLAAAILGFGYRQYYGYQTTKTACTLQLTRNLYFQNLGNNKAVITHLLHEAEEQECREALLAYYTLWRFGGKEAWTLEQLDRYIEVELKRMTGIEVNFEIDDAMKKLVKLGLVQEQNGAYRAIPIETALAKLDEAWDGFFPYHTPTSRRAA